MTFSVSFPEKRKACSGAGDSPRPSEHLDSWIIPPEEVADARFWPIAACCETTFASDPQCRFSLVPFSANSFFRM